MQKKDKIRNCLWLYIKHEKNTTLTQNSDKQTQAQDGLATEQCKGSSQSLCYSYFHDRRYNLYKVLYQQIKRTE